MSYLLRMIVHGHANPGTMVTFSEPIAGQCPYKVGDSFEREGQQWTVTKIERNRGGVDAVCFCERHSIREPPNAV